VLDGVRGQKHTEHMDDAAGIGIPKTIGCAGILRHNGFQMGRLLLSG